METFFAVIYALDQAASHVKLVLEVNKPFSTCYRTVCIWKKELLGGFNVGEQVIITFLKKLFIQLIHSSRWIDGIFYNEINITGKDYCSKKR